MTIARRPIASIEQVDGLQGALDGREAALGNPDADGKVLSSTTAGVRSWASPVDQAHRDAVTGIHGIVRPSATSVGLGFGVFGVANTSQYNTVVGDLAAGNSANVASIAAFGYGAARYAQSPGIVAFGYLAAGEATIGSKVAIGYLAMRSSTTGSGVAIGFEALRYNTAGANLVAIGNNAGTFAADGTTQNITGGQSLYIGNDTKASANGALYEVAIGNGATGSGYLTITLGSAGYEYWLPGATNKVSLGRADRGFKALYLHDGTDEWKVTINTSGVLTTTKV